MLCRKPQLCAWENTLDSSDVYRAPVRCIYRFVHVRTPDIIMAVNTHNVSPALLYFIGVLNCVCCVRGLREICDPTASAVAQSPILWQQLPASQYHSSADSRCDLCSKNQSLALPCCLCDAGSFIENNRCLVCPARHFCKGAHAEPSACPANSYDLNTTRRASMDDCVCDAGFFRTDNVVALALALVQNIVQLHDSRKLWCVLCPIGYICLRVSEQPTNRTSIPALVQKCPEMATTLAPGAWSGEQCVCAPGAYALADPRHNSSILSLCKPCERHFYCRGHAFEPSACPPHTVSSSRATSIAGCICLPPYVMLPTLSPDFLYNCVPQSMAAYNEMDVTRAMQQEQYNIISMEASLFQSMYASLPSTSCLSIETGL